MILLSSIILVAFSGCDTRFKPETVLSGYVTDLARSESLSIPSQAIVMPMNLPALRDRQKVLSTFDIGLIVSGSCMNWILSELLNRVILRMWAWRKS